MSVEIPVDTIDNVERILFEIARMVSDLSASGAAQPAYEYLTTAHAMLGDYAEILRLVTGKQVSDFERTADDFVSPRVSAVSVNDLPKPFSEAIHSVLGEDSQMHDKVSEPYVFFRPAGTQSPVGERETTSQMFGLAYVGPKGCPAGVQGPVGAAGEGPAKSQKVEGVPEYIYQYKIGANTEFKICSRGEYERWKQQKGVTVRKLLAQYTLIEEKNNH